jgi:AP2-like factor (ANT lineage)
METIMVKEEENLGKRRTFIDNGEVQVIRGGKRRRRGANAFNDLQNRQQEVLPHQQTEQIPAVATTVKRSSRFRGVSKHRWTGRYEAHLWDKLSWNVTQKKKGKQVYLGAYDAEESAARAYDLAALKYWGTSTFTNFSISDYEKEIEIMQTVTKEEYLASLRRKSSGFSRGVSKYRGVARHHHNGRWEARIGRVFGNKYLYLGTYSSQEEAARAYDIAAIEYRGINAVTNFDLSTYIRWLKPEPNLQVSPRESHTITEIPTLPCYANRKESKALGFETNPFTTDHVLCSPRKQDAFQSSNREKSSSPTALDCLLRSSVFRELVEKNSSVCEDNEANKQQGIGADDEYRRLFYDAIGDIPFVCSNRDSIGLQELELPFTY